MNIRVQLLCAYAGYGFLVLYLLGFVVLARFVPPPDPGASAEHIAQMFRANTFSIRLGMWVCVSSGALLLAWGGAVAVQIKRMEGRFSPLTYTWVAANACVVIEFIYPNMFWSVAAFRPEAAPEFIQRFNDLAWLPWLGIVSTGIIQCCALGLLTLLDKRSEPIYPRWFGYFQFWCALGLSPAGLIIFFKNGPLAWNGLIAFWIAASVAFVWVVVTTHETASAIKHQARLPDPDHDTELSARIATLEEQVARLSEHRAPGT